VIVLRFEADDQRGLERIQGEFRRALIAVKPAVVLPFQD
jgi:phosphomannomutase/phosphoglucomutase